MDLLAKSGAGAALALGVYALHCVRSRPSVHAVVAEYPQVVRSYPALCEALTSLSEVVAEEDLRRLVQVADQIHQHDYRNRTRASQWEISRLNTQLQRDVSNLCNLSSGLVNNDRFRMVMYARTDTLPEIERHLENILHNHLLRD